MKAKILLAIVVSLVMVNKGFTQIEDFSKKIESLKESGKAKDYLLRKLNEDPQNGIAMLHLGRIHAQEQSYDTAIEWLNKAKTSLTDNSEVYQWLGIAYLYKLQKASMMEKGIFSGKCLENLTKSVELNPANITSRTYLANYYMNAPMIAGGSIKKTKLQIHEIEKYDPLVAKRVMARLYLKENNLDSAINLYTNLISANPNDIDLYLELAMFYQQNKMYDKAFVWFEKTLQKDENSLVSLYQIGRTAVFSGKNLEDGEKCLSVYLTKEIPDNLPGHDAAHWRLGMIFELQGQNEKAISAYEKAIQMNPANPKYKKSLQSLQKE